ncbi:SDR family NAD(P)-dependent oxidoreductase [Agriterribacter humi]|jgi:NAD(P)-dependent dehydrogenase (short-subunit alcohol dehydrogenase family)|uniref:SDR family NAD(P)-dependent oxidoreductase n=1 Tax=Agriterribacter humi TaxID=1104781 RepID=UPI0012647B97|nr:SDR family oxidoreductase [Agriterribacter humi]
MSQRFTNKVVWVSGAAQGIGRGIAEYFAEAGAKVALIDIKKKEGSEVAESIRSGGGIAEFFFCDLNVEESIHSSIENTVKFFGDLHILVNNGAVNFVKDLHEYSSEEWDWQMSVNLKAIFLSFKYAYAHLRKHASSHIVNIGSVSSFVGQAKTPGYIAAKGAVIMLTKSIAIDYASEGIRCNAVCPGITDTPMLRAHMGNDVDIQERLQRVPGGRMLKPKEIAGSVAYLCCDDSAGVTGISLIVDGGYLATAEWKGIPAL